MEKRTAGDMRRPCGRSADKPARIRLLESAQRNHRLAWLLVRVHDEVQRVSGVAAALGHVSEVFAPPVASALCEATGAMQGTA